MGRGLLAVMSLVLLGLLASCATSAVPPPSAGASGAIATPAGANGIDRSALGAATPATDSASGAGRPAAPTADTAVPTVPSFKHIFVIVLENEAYNKVIDTPEAPYLSVLAKQYGLATNYHGITHPSLPNYLALTGGSTFGIATDCKDCFIAHENLVDQLEAAGKSWKAYMESMPQPCLVGNSGDLYRQRHDPFIYYDDVRTNPQRCNKIVPFTEFTADLQANALPDFTWITPNMCNDGHNCPLNDADSWLKIWVPKILAAPAWQDRGVLFITFDESDESSHGQDGKGGGRDPRGGHIPTLVLSPLGKPAYRSSIAYTHYSLLRTIEDAWGMPALGEANQAQPMIDFFEIPSATQQ